MVYSVHQAFSNSYNFEEREDYPDIPTASISTNANVPDATDSCKDISDPRTLLQRATTELKAAAKTTTPSTLSPDQQQNYWNLWSFWKKHPFLCKEPLVTGHLLLEHFLIVNNTKAAVESLHADLLAWLQLVQGGEATDATGSSEASELDLLREELCTTLYVMVLRPSQALVLLEEAAPPLLPVDLFSTLKRQLIGSLETSTEEHEIAPAGYLAQLKALFQQLLQTIHERYAQLVAVLRKQPEAWQKFLQNMLNILIQRLGRLLF